MSAAATPNPPTPVPGDPALAYKITADAYHHLVQTLRLALPPPPADQPGPEDFRRRDHAAIAAIAGFAPANAAEAELAAQFVAAAEHAKHCFRLSQLPETTPERAAKCGAQAAGMMRQTNSALRLLLRMQETRRKLQADPTACDRAAWTEHCALGLMAQALVDPVPAAEPAVAEPMPQAEPGEPQPAPHPAPAADHPEKAAATPRIARLPDSPEAGAAEAIVERRDPDLPARQTASPEPRAA